jgi:mono/diheme cytochrome c family protein
MPKNSDPLSPDQIAILEAWIQDGAVWPEVAVAAELGVSNPSPAVAVVSGVPADERVAFFEQKIRPIFVSHCYNCHSADTKPAGGLRVDDLDGLLEGGDDGPAVVRGQPEEGLLLKRVTSANPKTKMPKEGDALTAGEIADLRTWIKEGVAWPREEIPKSLGKIRPDYPALKTNHWAWQPLGHPPVPTVAGDKWSQSDLDRFVLARLKTRGLAPVKDADRTTLIRRVTYDLTGMPPTPAEVEAFLKDASADAFPKLVDRLLDSPRYGERWGRYWLDVARYGESTGPSRNVPYPYAWKYRDYVIDAVNRDVPFNRFIQEQVAGDLLPAATPAERDRLNTATGLMALGVKDVNQRFKNRFVMDNVDEKIDVVTRSVLALTVSCARCHDHKFDPIPTKDYYALAGIFTSTEDCAGVRNKMGGGGLDYYNPTNLIKLADYVPTEVPKEKVDKLEAEVAAAKKDWDAIRGTPEGLALTNGVPYQRRFRLKYEKLQAQLAALTDPVAQGHAVHGVREAPAIADTDVRIRGEAERRGPTVPRGFLTAFVVPDVPAIKTNESGRLELAQWLTSPRNPLVSRVFANRVWEHLFGQGIVTTVDNFGVMGDRPSNPELLDYLAGAFVQEGWSVKRLIRTIVLSRTYQLSSTTSALGREIDPDDRLVYRHAPRRLEAEEIRDGILAAAGDLELKPPAEAVVNSLAMVEIRDNGEEARKIKEVADRARCRSIYLPSLRGLTPSALAAFDPVDQTLVSGQRESTTVPAQALFMLNSTFIARESLALADKLLAEKKLSETEKVRAAFWLILNRAPERREVARVRQFIGDYATAYQRSPIAGPAAAVALAAGPLPGPPAGTGDGQAKPVVNPDDIDTADVAVDEPAIQPRTPAEAAWMNIIRSLYASAEFRFIR